ncbi:MAG: thiamine phosphate synthase [Pseudomonadota bacterium]
MFTSNCSFYPLYLIADYTICSPRPLITAVEEVMDHGIACVQLRMKNQASQDVLSLGKQLLALLRPRNIPLIINDHIEIAKTIDADGVHIGQTDKPYAWVRQQLGYKKIIGLSIENIQQAQYSQSLDCDYFGVGPIFATSTKWDANSPIGIENLKKMTSLLPKPIIAIGGINETNLHQVLSCQVSGIAVASAVLSATSPKKSTQALSHIISQYALPC